MENPQSVRCTRPAPGKISGLALIGYLAGAAVYILQYRLLH